MKLIAFAAALLLLVVGFSTAMGQDRAGDLKHVTLEDAR